MKNQAYKTAIRKADKQLRSKLETGDDLQHIDFHQLQIENQQFVVKIGEANNELLNLKRTSGRTVKTLNNMKKKLSNLTAEARFLEDEIKERKDNKKLRMQSRISPEMPQVVDYVNQKAEQYEIEAQKRTWERKLEIAEMAVKKIKSQLVRGP